MVGTQLPRQRTPIPGPRSRRWGRQLHRYESRNVTFVSARWPIFWERAAGANVWDVDGNRYVDLTAAFGVAALGHTNPQVTAAVRQQAGRMMHAMGDVHPNVLKLQLARELARLTYRRWDGSAARVLFANSGAEAVEAALKTAMLHTGRAGVICFEGAYHGLTYGALAATWRKDFRRPFLRQLGRFTVHVPYGRLPALQNRQRFGAVLVEPIQGRGGVMVPPDDFLPGLRRFCDREGMLLICDELYTGFGRTGRWFASEHWQVVPDLVCVGKALTNGMPLAACVGRAEVMDSWPESAGEALHTSTFLGHPLGCAAALAALGEMKRRRIPERAAKLGGDCLRRLARLARQVPAIRSVRGRGLMIGMEFARAGQVTELIQQLRQRGFITLPEGNVGEVLGITPPLVIRRAQLDHFLDVLTELLT